MHLKSIGMVNHLIYHACDLYEWLFRWMMVELRHLTSVCPQLDRGNMCPACPKVKEISVSN